MCSCSVCCGAANLSGDKSAERGTLSLEASSHRPSVQQDTSESVTVGFLVLKGQQEGDFYTRKPG